VRLRDLSYGQGLLQKDNHDGWAADALVLPLRPFDGGQFRSDAK
jgi:hypothetical protein